MHLLGTVCSSQPFAIYQPEGRQEGIEHSRVIVVGTEMLGDATTQGRTAGSGRYCMGGFCHISDGERASFH